MAQEQNLNDNNVQINMSLTRCMDNFPGTLLCLLIAGISRENGIVHSAVNLVLMLHVLGLCEIWFREVFSGKLISHYSGQKCSWMHSKPPMVRAVFMHGNIPWCMEMKHWFNADDFWTCLEPWSALGNLHLIWDNTYLFGWLQWLSARNNFATQGTLAMSGDNFDCHNCGRFYWLKIL